MRLSLQVRSEKDRDLIDEARAQVRSGERMSREQVRSSAPVVCCYCPEGLMLSNADEVDVLWSNHSKTYRVLNAFAPQ
jgi:hypothetical protein